MVRAAVFSFGLLALSPNICSAQAEDWRLEGEEDGVQVYTRLVDEAGNVMAVRVVTEVLTTLSRVMQYLDEPRTYPDWVHRCAEARKFNARDANNYYYASCVDLPFPFRDREVVARISQRIDLQAGTLHRKIVSVPDEIPPTDGYDRVRQYEAIYTVQPVSSGKLRIECIVHTDAGSGLPNWLRREIMTGGPVKSMQNLVELVR
jgi:hypothetical protein